MKETLITIVAWIVRITGYLVLGTIGGTIGYLFGTILISFIGALFENDPIFGRLATGVWVIINTFASIFTGVIILSLMIDAFNWSIQYTSKKHNNK